MTAAALAAAITGCESTESPSTPVGDAGSGLNNADATVASDGSLWLPTDGGGASDGGYRPADATVPPISASDTDLPCNVATVLADSCWYCHGKALNFGAPMALLNAADFTANGKITTSQTVGALTTARIADTANPMPPRYHPAQLDAADKQALNDWIAAGTPKRSTDAPVCNLPTVAGPGQYDSAPTGGPDDCENYYELRAHGQMQDGDKSPYDVGADLGNEDNSYQCFYFNAPYGADERGLWFAPLIDNSPILHHWLLYGADDETAISGAAGSYGPCSAAEPGRYLIAGWAPGAPETLMPNNVALHMAKKLVLEVHYYNNTKAAQKDRSGVKFCTTKSTARANTAGVHFTGSEGICVQPGQNGEVSGMCDPPDNGDIHIINVWPHMHKSATRMRIVINRRGGGQEVLHDSEFNFNDQAAYPKDDVILRPGDTMETRCYYRNQTNAAIHFGERTQDEMCYGFITSWPRGTLVTDPTSSLVNPIHWVALPIQPALRCLDPAGIFGSCNGVADYPF